jgi:hypothetical protein
MAAYFKQLSKFINFIIKYDGLRNPGKTATGFQYQIIAAQQAKSLESLTSSVYLFKIGLRK